MMKIKQAILFAAGQGKRLNNKDHKALLNINGEILIEKTINNLLKINVDKIIIITGFRHQDFLYLQKKYSNVEIIHNDHYYDWSTAYAGYLVKDYLYSGTILISADMFMTTNSFKKIKSAPVMAAIKRKTIKYDWIYELDSNKNIIGYNQSNNINDLTIGEWSFLNEKWAKSIRNTLESVAANDINYLYKLPFVEILIKSALKNNIILKPFLLDEDEQWDIDVQDDLNKAYNFNKKY